MARVIRMDCGVVLLAGRRSMVLRWKNRTTMNAVHRAMLSFLLVLISCLGCGSSQPVPIYYGEDSCNHCQMTIIDKQFGNELLTSTGKAYKFDSIECLSAFESAASADITSDCSLWVTDFSDAGNFIRHHDATFVRSTTARSPMGVGLFAFRSPDAASNFAREFGGHLVTWDEIRIIVKDAW